MADQKKELTKEEQKVQKYISKNPGKTYREACLAVLDSSEGLEEYTKKFALLFPEEIIRMKEMMTNTIYNLSKMKSSKAFDQEDKDKLNEAYNLVAEVQESLQALIDKSA